MGLKSSAYPVTISKSTTTVNPGDSLLTAPIDITKAILGGQVGKVRVSIALNTDAVTDYGITIRRNSDSATDAKLNADALFILKALGYYRFDIYAMALETIDFILDTATLSTPSTNIYDLQVQSIPINT